MELTEIAIKSVSLRDVQMLLHVLDDVELEESSIIADVARKIPLFQMNSLDVLFEIELAHNLDPAFSANFFGV